MFSDEQPEWKVKWPKNGSLIAWYRAVIRKCESIDDPDEAAYRARISIRYVAALGYVREALKHVNSLLQRLRNSRALPIVQTAELGAKICLEADDLIGMERYLRIAEATESLNTRKCDRGFSINAVRDFRAFHGVLDPGSAISDKQRIQATFTRSNRDYEKALKLNDTKSAYVAAANMETAAFASNDLFDRIPRLRRTIECYARIGELQSAQACIGKIDETERKEIVDIEILFKIGRARDAEERAAEEFDEKLLKLCTQFNPNIHFETNWLVQLFRVLVRHDRKHFASHLLNRTLENMQQWQVLELGWSTSSVYLSIAEAIELIDGPEVAKAYLDSAMEDAKMERRTDFRHEAIAAVIRLKAECGMLPQAIDDARKLRSKRDRRKLLAILLAKARKWKDLQRVLRDVESPEEAAEIAWSVKFSLPGGEPN